MACQILKSLIYTFEKSNLQLFLVSFFFFSASVHIIRNLNEIQQGISQKIDSLNNDGNDRPLKNRYTLFLNYQVVPHEPNKHPLQN